MAYANESVQVVRVLLFCVQWFHIFSCLQCRNSFVKISAFTGVLNFWYPGVNIFVKSTVQWLLLITRDDIISQY